jgi:hypothetical protein
LQTREQFVLAREFLDEVCSIVDCDPTHIACVPGNHDIHRGAHGPLHDGLRRLLRTIPIGEVSARIEQIRRYERASLIVTSNKPFSAWAEIFGDDATAAAMIDRLVHHAEILSLKGDSYRLKNHDLGAHPNDQRTN